MRQQISYHPPLVARVILGVLAGSFALVVLVSGIKMIVHLFRLISVPEETHFDAQVLFIPFISAAIFFYFYYKSRKTPVMEFDDQYLYIIRKSGEEKVEFKNITNVKQSLISPGVKRPYWYIIYLDSEGVKKSLDISVLFHEGPFAQFRKLVKKSNPKKLKQQ